MEREAIRVKVALVKALPRKSKFWTSKPDGIDELFMNVPVTKVNKVSEAKAKLLAANGNMTVQDLVDIGEDRDAFDDIVTITKGLGEVGLQYFAYACVDAKLGEAPKSNITSTVPTPTGQNMEGTRLKGAWRSGWWK